MAQHPGRRRREYTPGDRLARARAGGLAIVEGEVVDAYDSGFGKQVIVAVMLEGSDQPLTATFRAEAVELAA
jgi:hypothetical protein